MRRFATLVAMVSSLAACAGETYTSLPTVAELNSASFPLGANIYAKYPQLEECGPTANHAFADTITTRRADALIDAWGEPEQASISAWNLLIWMIPIAPLTVWEWTGFERSVEVTVMHPLTRGFQPVVWMCDFGALKSR